MNTGITWVLNGVEGALAPLRLGAAESPREGHALAAAPPAALRGAAGCSETASLGCRVSHPCQQVTIGTAAVWLSSAGSCAAV